MDLHPFESKYLRYDAAQTIVENAPCQAKGLAGIQIVAMKVPKKKVAITLQENHRTCGVIAEGNDAHYLVLSDVGASLRGNRSRLPANEMLQTFRLLEDLFTSVSWSMQNVCCTCYYLRDILTIYDDFNRIRNDAFKRIPFTRTDHGSAIPASTGISGGGLGDGCCVLDLLAIRPLPGTPYEVRRLTNPKQNEATTYGSAFSRGIKVSLGKCSYIFA